jgi:hypothetical protein
MHAALHFMVYWLLSFYSLAMALFLLNIYFGIIGKDIVLRSLGSEAVIALIASLVEAVSLWLILTYAPGAIRAMIAPGLVVAFIYRMTHLEEDWDACDVVMLLVFQIAVGFLSLSLYFGHLQSALYLLLFFGALLALIAFFARGLWD